MKICKSQGGSRTLNTLHDDLVSKLVWQILIFNPSIHHNTLGFFSLFFKFFFFNSRMFLLRLSVCKDVCKSGFIDLKRSSWFSGCCGILTRRLRSSSTRDFSEASQKNRCNEWFRKVGPFSKLGRIRLPTSHYILEPWMRDATYTHESEFRSSVFWPHGQC